MVSVERAGYAEGLHAALCSPHRRPSCRSSVRSQSDWRELESGVEEGWR